LPSVDCRALGKDLVAECPHVGTRQTKASPPLRSCVGARDALCRVSTD